MLFLFVSVLIQIIGVIGIKLDSQICRTLTPLNITLLPSESPYKMNLTYTELNVNEDPKPVYWKQRQYSVLAYPPSNLQTPYSGFLVQARIDNSIDPFGFFILDDGPGKNYFKTDNCTSPSDVFTDMFPENITELSGGVRVLWMSPNSTPVNNVTFHYSFVDNGVGWCNVRGESLVVNSPGNSAVPSSSTNLLFILPFCLLAFILSC